ncbi:MAG TPA: alpha/beta hydrolase [Blastocatellia bacterium]|nr:alpha/beta hydrolase [Blastocatellia bacterium]
MATVSVNGISFAYDERGDRANPAIVFTHSLVWDREMFADVVADLADQFHIINLDQHGHGESGYRASFTLEEMAEDYAALLDALGLESVHWAGLSMGGMTGMRLAIARPERVRSLVLMDTSSRPEMQERRANYMQLADAIRAGMASAVVDQVLPFFFAPSTFANRPDLIARYRDKFIAERDREGVYQASLAVFNRGDITDQLEKIKAPTLVIVGEHDIATTPDRSQLIAERIPNARLVRIPNAAHMSATEQPAMVANLIREFIQSVEGS